MPAAAVLSANSGRSAAKLTATNREGLPHSRYLIPAASAREMTCYVKNRNQKLLCKSETYRLYVFYKNEHKMTVNNEYVYNNIPTDCGDDLGTLIFWCKMRYWEPHEAAALILGILPTDLTDEMAGSPEFISLKTLIARISSTKTPKLTFILARLKKLNIKVPDFLFDTCLKYNKIYSSKSMKNSELREALKLEREKKLTTLEFSNGKEKGSLLIIAYAALKLKFGATPLYDKAVASKLEDQLSAFNTKISGRTLDKWLEVINDFGAERSAEKP
ncbi:hypothetical protein [Xanthobacter sediminis]